MTYAKGLKCRECGQEYPLEPMNVCEYCFGPLEVDYDYGAIAGCLTRERIAAGPKTMWRYQDLLPVGKEIVDMGTGFTPLLKADNLGRELGLPNLYLKNDSVNPTFSFKDRVVGVAISRAKEFGFKTVACASTGNLAASVAAHAARAGMDCYIFIPHDLERAKILGTSVYGPKLVAVEGNYDEVNRLSSEVCEKYGWAFVNINLRPYYAEGSKTLAYETAEQLGWVAPDHCVAPMASGSVLTKIRKGFRELMNLGLLEEREIRISGAQAAGCSPIVTAYKGGVDNIIPVKPQTIAKSLAIGNPADGYYAVRAIRNTGGWAEEVGDQEIVDAMLLLARTEGVFTETAGGVTVAVLTKLARSGRIKAGETVAAYITGNGLKTLEAVAGQVEDPFLIKPTLSSFESNVVKSIA